MRNKGPVAKLDSKMVFQKDAVLFGSCNSANSSNLLRGLAKPILATQKARSCLSDFIDNTPAVKIASDTLFEKPSFHQVWRQAHKITFLLLWFLLLSSTAWSVGPRRVVESPTKMIVPQGDEIYKGLNVGPPTNVVQTLDRRLSEYKIGKRLSEEAREFNRTLKHSILQELFDIRELTQRAMGRYWQERSDLEQKELVDLLTAVLEETSISAKENSAKRGEKADFDVEYMGDRPLNQQKGLAFAATVVHLLKENLNIKINYELKRLGDTWRVYDVIVDGASLVQNYRYSFHTLIKEHGYPVLVRRLRNKLNDLRSPKEKENE